MKILWVQHWTESERGWGQRPDGISIHLSKEDCVKFVENYNQQNNNLKDVPSCYSFADGEPVIVGIEEELFDNLSFYKFGSWRTNSWLSDNKKAGKIQYYSKFNIN